MTPELYSVGEAARLAGISPRTLSRWFYEGILMDGGLLAIDPSYLSITGGRERWLYRVARKHAGGAGEEGFAISLRTLFEIKGETLSSADALGPLLARTVADAVAQPELSNASLVLPSSWAIRHSRAIFPSVCPNERPQSGSSPLWSSGNGATGSRSTAVDHVLRAGDVARKIGA